jgi:hypothetical protein
MKLLAVLATTICVSLGAWAGADRPGPAPQRQPDGELIYKTNCTRCHNTPPALTRRQTRAVVRHMRVRANLVAGQADAVLLYLLDSARK